MSSLLEVQEIHDYPLKNCGIHHVKCVLWVVTMPMYKADSKEHHFSLLKLQAFFFSHSVQVTVRKEIHSLIDTTEEPKFMTGV